MELTDLGQTKIPKEELELFMELPNIRVVFDVGARVDGDYIQLRPNITLHAFEPHKPFFEVLERKLGHLPNVHLNNCGVTNEEAELPYSAHTQCMSGGDNGDVTSTDVYPTIRIDDYVKKNRVGGISFFKIDVEGHDYNVLLGARKSLKITRFLQYEYWNDPQKFHGLLEKDFDMEYVGYRNVLCMNKKLVPKKTRARLKELIAKREYAKLA